MIFIVILKKNNFASLVYFIYTNGITFSKIKIRQCKYLNNIVEQDHRFIKWRMKNGLGFKSFESVRQTLSGIEVEYMLRKIQMVRPSITMFKTFCKLAG
jgi:putative transposase